MTYDAAAYWNKRDNPNASPVAPDWMIRFIRDHARSAADVFELGPGVGRTFAAYAPGQRIVTLDLSRRYAEAVRARADALNLPLSQTWLDRPDEAFPFADAAFEVGVCVQVLMHVPPDCIAHSLGELSRVASRTAIVTSLNPDWDDRVRHCFNHDYARLCADLGCLHEDPFTMGSEIGFILRRAG